ncbi:sulfotransferase family protein [Thioalbus denitrificans]|uniref:Sulfotransferase family protein n=1 Tax=Thioalbus denitrificans TaxID=547122 RepID=A0A369CEC0_9GAMM|nr:sulfotransferase [Thioalbus denitrificans]RCX32259.1 sulfotransferase family protein [Thioalbus denitrificans]
MKPQPASLEPSLDRGLTSRRLLKAIAHPLWALRNARYHWVRTISDSEHVFVMGPPRSGTTLMQSLLRSHPGFCGLEDETWFFFRRNYLDLRYPELPQEEMSRILRQARDSVDLFDAIANALMEQKGARRFVEKTPEHALCLPFLTRHFPRSKFVFMLRDPRDGYLSALRNPRVKSGSIPMYTELWKRSVAAFVTAQESGAKIELVRYESLCRDPRAVLEKVMTFLGESLDPAQLQSENYSKTRVRNQQGHQRLAERITDASVGQWRAHLSPEQLEEFQERIGPWMERMGYTADGR